MKKYLLSFAVALISVVAFGQTNQTNIPVTASIELGNMVSATKVTDVNFGGAYIPINGMADVDMDGKGVVTPTGTTLFNQTKQSLGAITVQAPAEARVQFAVSSPTVTLTNNIKDGDEPYSTLDYSPVLYDIGGNVIDRMSPPIDYDDVNYGTIYVGGSVIIPADVYRGVYTGSFTVSLIWI